MRKNARRSGRNSHHEAAEEATPPGTDTQRAIRPSGRTDWARVRATTDEEIARQIAEDPDTAPELDAAWLAAAEVHMPRAQRVLTLRVDGDVIDWFKQQGRGYQARMNAVLRGYMHTRDPR